ncbi:hypothetical protein CPAR01_15297 [Colletotrichum paranaense]|uniref:Isochorismatase-like domain-containing protein n=1 Tax=Colletotrichum paranaense TaxID=1914294 RepID=A0ABQ9RZ94_9PEZI|nr:uncharacterized protein CPAR01_15297 [Colletotrichum paranaense]KAK1519804.1 hypothetical protein CPAR01_15297 [Colletotrichum paranaense]
MPVTTVNASSPNAYGPSETALLLLDWYSLFVESRADSGAGAALDIAIQFRKWAKLQGIAVMHCLIDTHGTPTAHPSRLQRHSELAFYRIPGHISALKSPSLLEHLGDKVIKSLVITGLRSSGCGLGTMAAATDAEFATTVIDDTCADADEEFHRVISYKFLPWKGYVKKSLEFGQDFEARVED